MDSKQTKIAISVVVAVLLLWLISPFLFGFREPALHHPKQPAFFDSANAYRLTREFVIQYPRRVFGSLESRQSTGYLHDYLVDLGYSVEYSHFDGRIGGSKQVGRNVVALKEGDSYDIVAIIAHFDTARTTEQGAMKNGAAVGVLLEMARLFSDNPTSRSLLFVFSDGEEWGMLGAKDLAENYSGRNRIVAVLSLDHVGLGRLSGFCLEETGQLAGFTPPWLRRLAQETIEVQDLPVRAPSGFKEHLERALSISWADQGPFLAAGIPAINLGSTSTNRLRERAVYHSPQDTVENLDVTSIEKYGVTAERIVRVLDKLPSIPKESQESFNPWGTLFLGQNVIRPLHALAFTPLAVIFFFHLKNFKSRLTGIRVGRELLAFFATSLPFWALYISIGLFRGLRILPAYTLYPPMPKDPALVNPPWGLLGTIFGAVLVVAAVSCAIGILAFRDFPKPDYYASKLGLLGLMLILVSAALLHNSYWATIFLLLPAWTWGWIQGRQRFGKRFKNGMLILAAGIPYFAALCMYASRLHMSWNFAWYQVLALNSGLFTGIGFLLGVAAIAVGIRFLAIQFRNSTL